MQTVPTSNLQTQDLLGEDLKRLPARVCLHVHVPIRFDVRARRVVSTLHSAGMDVLVVDMEDNSARAGEEKLYGVPVKHIPISFLYKRARLKLWFLARFGWYVLRGTVQLLRTPADIYHACDLNTLPACFIASRLRKKPLIFETYELPLEDPKITKWRRLYALAVRVLRYVIPRCAGVITVSPPLVRELRCRYGGPEAMLLRNVPVYHAPVSSNRLRQHLNLDPSTRIALYQGYFQENRGLDRLVRAARYLDPGMVIVLLGQGGLQANLESLIASEGVSERIRLVPAAAYEELLEWTASADIGLIVSPPTHSANARVLLPNKLFEYLMAGLPVLASPIEAVVDIIRRYRVGAIVDSLDAPDLGRAISTMLANGAALEQMRRHALAAAQREFRWDVEQNNLLYLYKHVLEGQPQGRGAMSVSIVERAADGEAMGSCGGRRFLPPYGSHRAHS